MPLKPGSDQATVAANVRELSRSGYTKDQAVAIALANARKTKGASTKKADPPKTNDPPEDPPDEDEHKKSDNLRPILEDPIDKDGLFTVPTSIKSEDEVRYAKRRHDSIRVSQYADSKCGLPATFDSDGGYLCGGRKDGSSGACNKLVGTECLIRSEPIDDQYHQSCGMWEVRNAGDPEGRYCPGGKLDDKRIGFGATTSDLGFSCQRCTYFAKMDVTDSEGRDDFCRLKGHPVEDNACCEDNEPAK